METGLMIGSKNLTYNFIVRKDRKIQNAITQNKAMKLTEASRHKIPLWDNVTVTSDYVPTKMRESTCIKCMS